ncbi:MAG: C-terminal binding protein [Planctomycetota bacterium]|nr:C-terminal binding protein [Planctomycetota bacterium]
MARYKVGVVDLGYPHYEWEKEELAPVGAEIVLRDDPSPEGVRKLCRECDGILLRQTVIDAPLIREMKKCKVIARYGVGVDNVDIEAATAAGIWVAKVPPYCSDEVAEHALALILACARKLTMHERYVRDGKWDLGPREKIYRIQGRTLGMVGCGSIGAALRKKVRGLDLKVLVFDPYLPPDKARAMDVELVPLERVCRESDFISIHAALTKETRHMIGAAQIALMKPTAILVNTSRGPLVNEAALYDALAARRIAFAGLDVFEKEPLPMDSPLRKLDNVILTDHAAWYSEQSLESLQRLAARAVAAVLRGEMPECPVNDPRRR